MRMRLAIVVVLVAWTWPLLGQVATTPGAAYDAALERERALVARPASQRATVREVRAVVAAYQDVVHRWPQSGYADNALWQAAGLADDLYQRAGQEADRRTAIRLLQLLVKGYPSSSLRFGAQARLAALDRAAPPPVPRPHPLPKTLAAPAVNAPADAGLLTDSPVRLVAPAETSPPPATGASAPAASPAPPLARLEAVRRLSLPGVVRVTLELDREVPFSHERLEGPPRVFFDLAATGAADDIANRTLSFHDDVVRKVRLGQQEHHTTRVVLDLAGASRYTVFTLYNPFRVVVDVERQQDGADAHGPAPAVAPLDASPAVGPVVTTQTGTPESRTLMQEVALGLRPATPSRADAPSPADPTPEPPAPPPLTATAQPPVNLPRPQAPAANARGGYSIARQLGLGVSRIVIDPGHGGHDPGALGKRVTEAELVLDVALRLEKLLLAQPGFEVVLTRRTDVFVPLEERTAMANREGADLFLSIHANASRNPLARGVETYFLNFAQDAEAAAVAARENSASERAMHHLPDIVKAIALTNKLDESRDFAQMVQRSLVSRLRPHNRELKDLGVKQAPFVVLIGAAMPSVLAEISFVTHAAEGQLLRTPAYRQRIAEALHDAIVRYQRSLKTLNTLAHLDEE
jgi:N-acetylmuramoyl-L-alanine amidase